MKLHLPSSLRKALLACLAALAMPAFTFSVGSGSAFLGGAALFSLLSAESSYADFNPGNIDWGATEDIDTTGASGDVAFNITGNKTATIHGANGSFNFTTTNTDANLKLDFTSAENAGTVYEIKGTINVAKLWVTTSSGYGGLYCTSAGSSLVGTRDIYINGAQFWFRYEGATLQNTNFHIGNSVRPEGEYSGALRISRNVTTTGVLDVMEDAVVNFQDNNSGVVTLSVARIEGNGSLTVKSSNGTGHVLELTSLNNGRFNHDLTVGAGVTLKINSAGKWSGVGGTLTMNGNLHLEAGEWNCSGTFTLNGGLSANAETDNRICIMGSSNASLTIAASDTAGSVGGFDVRDNATVNIYRDLTLYRYGLWNNQDGITGNINIGSDEHQVTVTIDNSVADRGFWGSLIVAEGSTLAKTGSSAQVLHSAIGGNGKFSVSGGTLTLGANADGGTVSGLATSDNGTLNVLRNLTVSSDGLSGTGGTINLGGASNNVNVSLANSTNQEYSGALNVAAGSTLTKSDFAKQELSGALSIAGNLVINDGKVEVHGNGGTSSTVNSLSGTGGEFLVADRTVVLSSGGIYSGYVGLSWGGTIELGADMTVGGLSVYESAVNNDYIDGAYTGTVRGVNGVSRQLIIDGGAGESGATALSRDVTFEQSVQLVKRGEGTQRMVDATIEGSLTIEEGTLRFSGGANTLNGALGGGEEGALEVSGAETSLAINGGGSVGTLNLTSGSTVTLGNSSEITLTNLRADTDAANDIKGNGRITVNVADSASTGSLAKLTLADGVELVKTGEGTWSVGGLVINGTAQLAEGTLEHIGGAFRANRLVMAGGTLAVAAPATVADPSTLTVNTLSVTSAENRITWSDQNNHGVQRVMVGTLTGSGSLDAGALGTGTGSVHRELLLQSLANYNGRISGSAAGASKIYLGSMSMNGSSYIVRELRQADGSEAVFDVEGGVYSNAFRKTGAGALTLNKLTVEHVEGGGLWMDYDGTLNIAELVVGNNVVLHYTRGVAENQLKIKVDSLYNTPNMSYGVDVFALEGESLANGVCLGIVSSTGTEDVSLLSSKLKPWGADGVEFSLGWVKNAANQHTLYMYVERYNNPDNRWDPDWGAVTLLAPGRDEMREHEVLARDVEWLDRSDERSMSFLANTLELSDLTNSHYDGGSYGRLIRLVDGPKQAGSTTWATVMGGELYKVGPAERLEQNTWISLIPERDSATGKPQVARYHLLVGGSSCFTSEEAASGTIAGFVGNTHIQMEGGEVDYIVGGNHLSNAAFVFEGKSYISIYDGQVNGSVVGGSTITTGAAGENVHEFTGDTRIAVHSVLSNADKTPVISAPADASGLNVGSAFTAIVGGNAWVGMPEGITAGNADPSFHGSSSILVDLVTPVDDEIVRGATTGNFDKAIVGGNYTAFSNEKNDPERSTTFKVGDEVAGAAASITIRATDDAIFTGGVNGASRRASGGSGQTIFEGDTSVVIAGGTYSEAIAGGFWFEPTTTGNHSSSLTGDTLVSIEGGRIWRVVGGSYSLGGGSDSAESHVGSSLVEVRGGSFSADYGSAVGQPGLSLVAGGNYYNESAGSDYTHTGGTSGVVISGGSFDGVLVIGGDYVDAAASETCAASMEGGSFVHIAAAQGEVQLHGLVAGGSYLTDAEAGGAITISAGDSAYATEVIIGEGAVVEGEGVAVVAGSVIVDDGQTAGKHRAVIEGDTHLQVTGGSVSGHLVGGSYAPESQASNALSVSGASCIELTGGSIEGSIYGGHYSSNVDAPDVLSMAGASILLDGSTVKGDIVGGHYRSARAALSTSPTMGDVTIELKSGQLEGNVYAAGWHSAVNSSQLNAKVASTTVTLSPGVQFGPAPADVAAASITTWVVSGGFYKASASDASAVTGAASLVFDGASFDNLSQLAFRDFDTVSLAADITLAAGQLSVMDRGKATHLTKQGEGMLTLAGGLLAANGSAFAGRLVVDDGILALGASQALDAGIGFNLSQRTHKVTNDKATAYLQAVNGAQLTAKKGTQVELSGQNLASGFYYLTGELSGLSASAKAEDIFNWEKEGALTWEGMADAASYKYELMLKDSCLVLRVHRYTPDKWIWEGDVDGIWNNDSTTNWSREGVTSLNNEDVFFDAGAVSTDVRIQGSVEPRSIYVESGNYVFSAYDSTAKISMSADGKLVVGSGNADLPAELILRVSSNIPGVELMEGGKLVLESQSALPATVKVWFNGGVFAYGEDDSSGKLYNGTWDLSDNVQADSTGIVRVQVGRVDTAAPSTENVTWGSEETLRGGSSVNASEGIRRILENGLEKSGRAALTVHWLETDALYQGAYEGSLSALGGKLTMHAVSSVKGNITFGGNSAIEVAKGATLQFIAESSQGNTVANRLDIARSFVSVDSTASDAQTPATVIIGTDDVSPQSQSNYRLSGNNADFEGVIELRGRSGFMADSVRAADADALGGKNTTLVLAGRNIVMEGGNLGQTGEGDRTIINAGEVQVKAGTVNYLGYAQGEEDNTATGDFGQAWSSTNQYITITGKLTGSGTIANSRGNAGRNSAAGRNPYVHTLSGDISEFTGTIIAGSRKSPAANKGFTGESNVNFPGAYSASSWVLTGDSTPKVVHASFAGLGSIIFAYENVGAAGLLVDGNVGTDAAEDGVGNTVRIENRMDQGSTLILGGSKNLSEGALIFNSNNIQLGDAQHAATWSGSLLRLGDFAGDTASAFVLANGTLNKAFTAAGKNGVLLKVDTAEGGRVRVAQTAASVFDEIAVHNGGRLSDISGDIIVGSGAGDTVRLVLGFDKDSVDATPGAVGDYLINSKGGNIDMTHATPGIDVEFEFDNESFIEVLLRHRDAGAQTYLHVLSGGGEILLGNNEKAFSDYFSSSASNAAILGGLGFKYMGVDQGDIIMSGSSKEVYLVLGDESEWKGDSHEVTAYNVLHPYKATVIDSGQTLTINVPYRKLGAAKPGMDTDGLHINNLVGLENSTLLLQNKSQSLYESALVAWEDELAKWEQLSAAEKEFISRPVRPTYEGDVTFVLSNALRVVSDGWALPDGVSTEALKGIDTYFDGSILAEEGTTIRKTGAGTLHVGLLGGSGGLNMESNYYLTNGVLSVRGGELRLEEGGLALRGEGNRIGSLVFAYAGPASGPSEDRALTVSGCTLLVTNSMSEEAGSYTVDDSIRLEYGAELIYSGEESLLHNLSISSDTKDGWFTVKKEKHADIVGTDADDQEASVVDPRIGKLTLASAVVSGAKLRVLEGELNFTEGSAIKTSEVYVQDGLMSLSEGSSMKADKLYVGGTGVVDISSTTGNTLRELTGDGTLQGAEGGELTYVGDRSSTFSGTLAGTALPQPLAEDDENAATGGKGSKLTINQGIGALTFQNVVSDAKAKWDVTNNGNWVVDEKKGKALQLGQLLLGAESATDFVYNPTTSLLNMHAFDADSFAWEKGAKITIRSSNDDAIGASRVLLGTSREDVDVDRANEMKIYLRGLPFLHYSVGNLVTSKAINDEGKNEIYLELINREDNGFTHAGMHKNARVGANFFWEVTRDTTTFRSKYGENYQDTDIYKISNALADMLNDVEENLGDRTQLDNTLAAGAGSATAVLSNALTQDLQRQLSAIRNRTTTMSAEPGYDAYGDKPLYNVWLNAESSYHKLNADGLAPGFTLNSWGGSVGVDMAFNRTTTVGVAVTAMYGDLKASAADSAKGDMDTTYISLFARKAHGAWLHTFIMSAGIADVSFNRTVNYGTGSYQTTGSTDGNMMGALYELGYSKAIKADGSAILQTVFNAELRHAQINGYTERGSDAGVQVDDMEQTAITFGAGVRAQAVVGANALNRSSILEGRVLVKCDVGDRSGTATTRLARGADVSGEVESAEIGAMGLELGAGLSIPVGVQGSFYVDASVELRSGYTSMDANVGYRVSF